MSETEPGEVHLPPSVHHGGPNAYGHYRCRCRLCKQWRRDYDNGVTARNAWLRGTEFEAARQYAKSKGVHVSRPGPFWRNPTALARMIAAVLGEDFYRVVDEYRKRNPQ